VPAILAATAEPAVENDDEDERRERKNRQNQAAGKDRPIRRVVVSTHTIALQEQLVKKDIPLLRSVIPNEFTAVLVKGRGNYLSKRRLKTAQERAISLFNSDEEMMELRKLTAWAKESTDGSLADLAFRPTGTVWDEIA